MSDDYCWSHGPRIGNDGRPVCFRPEGHSGPHRAHPESGFECVTWGSPTMPVPESVRDQFWTPERAS